VFGFSRTVMFVALGFMCLTPENAIAAGVAGVRTFVLRGAVTFLIGAAVAAVGTVIPRTRPRR
jgi:hypothetical protein